MMILSKLLKGEKFTTICAIIWQTIRGSQGLIDGQNNNNICSLKAPEANNSENGPIRPKSLLVKAFIERYGPVKDTKLNNKLQPLPWAVLRQTDNLAPGINFWPRIFR